MKHKKMTASTGMLTAEKTKVNLSDVAMLTRRE